MRKAFIHGLTELARHDPRVVLLTGDLGFMVIEPFVEEHPDRFFNIGVAEQNMVGVATGLADAGFLPFAYSIATFATLRPFEFIRNGPVLHQLPVRIVGVGGGFEYGHAGPTHHALEDFALTRSQPGLTVIAPADHQQAAAALRATWDLPGPVYYRLGKDDKTTLQGLDGRFSLGATETIRRGADVAIVATGAISAEAVKAADLLVERGANPTVVVVGSLAPAPVDDLAGVAAAHHLVVTVEAHSVVGGLGSLVAEVMAERGLGSRLVRCGVRGPSSSIGSESFLNHQHGLSAEAIARTSQEALSLTR